MSMSYGLDVDTKRLTLFCGHYGSGKTNIALNYAVYLAKLGKKVSIADLDIVNPYFRSADSFSEIEQKGIRCIGLPFANSNVDLPFIPSEAYSLVEDRSRYAVMDIGGDERGAYALGLFADYIKNENNFNMLYVVNFYRPLTAKAEDAYGVMNEIESACKIRFTGIINNSNLGKQTRPEDIEKTFDEIKKLEMLSNLKTVMVSAMKEIARPDWFSLSLQKKYWES